MSWAKQATAPPVALLTLPTIQKVQSHSSLRKCGPTIAVDTENPIHMGFACLHAGMPTEGTDQVLAAAKKVQEMGADVVLAKLGTKGSMFIQKDEVLQQDIITADKVSTNPIVHVKQGDTG